MALHAQIGKLIPPFEVDLPSEEARSTAQAEYRGFRSLVERANDVFGDDLKASRWLSTPSADLGGKIPIQVAQGVKYGAEEIERIFEPIFLRIEHGIYS